MYDKGPQTKEEFDAYIKAMDEANMAFSTYPPTLCTLGVKDARRKNKNQIQGKAKVKQGRSKVT